MVNRTEDLKTAVEVAVGAIGCMVDITGISRGVAEVNRRTQTLAAASQQMVASVAEIASSSEAAATDAESAREIAATGKQSADHAVRTVHTIAESVRDAGLKVDRLSDTSAKIGTILNTIEAIAKQTNLLALNATIEAARAGEAGKGFAVVAGEVKSLANQTAKATVDIRQMIAGLRADIASIVTTMEASATAVEEGERVIMQTGDQISVIADRADGVTHRMQEIAGILNQQQLAADEIAQGVAGIAGIASENNDHLQTVLGGLDQTFNTLTRQFKSYEDCTDDQAILAFGRSDHAAFKKRVLDGVLGRTSLQAHDLPDHQHCRLGKWYLAARDGSIGRLPSFARLDTPHAAVHEFGKRALELKSRGDQDAAFDEIQRMETASQAVLTILDELSEQAANAAGR